MKKKKAGVKKAMSSKGKKTAGKKASGKKTAGKQTAGKKAAGKKKGAGKKTSKAASPKKKILSVMKKAKAAGKKLVARAAKLTESGMNAADSFLREGSPAPDFRLPSDSGKEVSLSDYRGKTVVLYFYPKDDTPGCTQESCDFRDSFSRVQSKGAVVLGVSKDSVASHQKFKEKYSLPFPLVSDESGKMLESYKVWREKSNYGRNYMGIDRTTYLIDVDNGGQAKVRKVYPKVKVNGHVDEILKDLG